MLDNLNEIQKVEFAQFDRKRLQSCAVQMWHYHIRKLSIVNCSQVAIFKMYAAWKVAYTLKMAQQFDLQHYSHFATHELSHFSRCAIQKV